MAHQYSNNELMDMVITYGAANENCELAARLYAQRFPNRYAPAPGRFLAVVQRGRDTGYLQPHRGRDGGPGRARRVLAAEEQILNLVEEDPGSSTRQIARQVNVSNRVVWRTLREEQMYPFHVQRVQSLQPADHNRRVTFCQWLINEHQRHPLFTSEVLVTDEACFTRNGVFNFHNTHHWAIENPHAIRQSAFQQRFSVNLWAGIFRHTLVGPFVIPARLDGGAYLEFLQQMLPDLLDDVPLDVRQRMYFLHDGAPPHFRQDVRQFLNNTFPGHWVGRSGPVAWPPRSPDLNPLDFFLWGYMKSTVYKTEVNSVEELNQRIHAAANGIRNEADMFTRVCQNWIRRAQLCVEMEGGHFEHLM